MNNNIPVLNFDNKYNCYVLLAISRKKDTPEITCSKEIVFREVVKNKEEIKRKYNKIKTLAKNYRDEDGKKYPFYIYITVNARNSLKGMFKLKEYLDKYTQHIIYGNDCSDRIKKLDGVFISCLMKQECKAERKFLIDLDNKENKDKLIRELDEKSVKIYHIQETRNGFHIITEPFNYEWISDIEIKTDGLLFLEYIEKG